MKKLEIKPHLTIKEYGSIPDVEKIRDAMQLDSEQSIFWLNGKIIINGEILTVEADMRVNGDVRVTFRDREYRSASKMPKELLDCYANGTDPEKIAENDGRKYETPYYVSNNNWLEECITITDSEGKLCKELYDVCDTDNYTEEDYRKMFEEDILELTEGMKTETSANEQETTDEILSKTRNRLKNIIRRNTILLFLAGNGDEPDWDKDEEYTVSVSDYGCGTLKTTVAVSDLHTDYEGTEERTVKEIRAALDGNIFVTFEEDNDETPADELETDFLAALARWSEQAINEWDEN